MDKVHVVFEDSCHKQQVNNLRIELKRVLRQLSTEKPWTWICILNRIEIRLVTVFKYKTVEVSHVCHLHCTEINTGHCSHGQGKRPHSSPPGLTSQQSYQDFSVVELFSLADSFCTLVRCLSCMTCSSPRSIYDPGLRHRRRRSTASPLSFVRPSANCSPVGAQHVAGLLLLE